MAAYDIESQMPLEPIEYCEVCQHSLDTDVYRFCPCCFAVHSAGPKLINRLWGWFAGQ